VRFSVSAKIFAAFILLLVLFGGVSVHGVVQMHGAREQLRAINQGYLRLFIAVKELQLYQGYLRTVFELDAERWDAKVKDNIALNLDFRARTLRGARGALAAIAALEPRGEDRKFLDTARADLDWIEAQFQEDAREVSAPGPAEARRERVAKVSFRLQMLASPAKRQVTAVAERVERIESEASFAALGLTLAAALCGIAVTLAAHATLRPLRRLSEGARQLARGDLRGRVEVRGQDEIADLSRDFNAMAAALEEREARLIRSERLAAIGRMAAHIAHEVRNPLSSIGLNAELLEEELTASPAGAKLCRAIQNEVDRLAALTEQYLRFARLPQPRRERLALGPVVASLLDLIAGDARARGVTLTSRIGALPPADIDEGQLRQALLNLCKNAVEAMDAGGTLTVTAAAADGVIELAVADTGPGIPEEMRARIFEPFFSTKEHGTGLGLALTQHVITAHGGTIEVTTAAGQGTTFTIRLPVPSAA
jgi:signal transduction histidine kinase